jgi:urease accessory protein
MANGLEGDSMKGGVERQGPGIAASLMVLVVWLLWHTEALAHVETGEAGGLLSGLAHPVSGLDHVLAMVAVGLWGAQLGAPAIWALPVAFPMMMACGGMLGLMDIPLPGTEIGIAVSAVVLGALILGEVKMVLYGAIAVVAFFAIFHGHAHGTELAPGENALLYSLGFVVSTGTLHAIGIGIGLVHKWDVGRIVLRGAGLVVAAGGLYFLWSALV